MRHFNDIDPLTVAQDPRVVASIQDDKEPTVTYYFLIDGDHMIVSNTNWKESKNGSTTKSNSRSEVYSGI